VLLNKDMIAVHQDPLAVPGDRRGFTADPGCAQGYCQIWCAASDTLAMCCTLPQLARTVAVRRSRPLANGDLAAVMYNRGTASQTITLNFGVANSSWAGKRASLYDLWQHNTVGVFTGSYSATVEGHGVVAVRMTAV